MAVPTNSDNYDYVMNQRNNFLASDDGCANEWLRSYFYILYSLI